MAARAPACTKPCCCDTAEPGVRQFPPALEPRSPTRTRAYACVLVLRSSREPDSRKRGRSDGKLPPQDPSARWGNEAIKAFLIRSLQRAPSRPPYHIAPHRPPPAPATAVPVA